MLQHILPFVTCHRRHWLGGSHRAGDSLFDDIRRGQGGPEGDFIGIFVGDLQIGIGLDGFIVQIKRIDVFQFGHRGPTHIFALSSLIS